MIDEETAYLFAQGPPARHPRRDRSSCLWGHSSETVSTVFDRFLLTGPSGPELRLMRIETVLADHVSRTSNLDTGKL
jgi:hypothetical protein